MHWQRIHSQKPTLLGLLTLGSLTIPYRAGVFLRRTISRYIEKTEAPGKVISIGNITVGGAGKTPMVFMLAVWARRQGYPASIISRGYKGSHKNGVLHVSDGRIVFSSPEECGDEPYMMARRLKDVPVLVSKNRFLGCLESNKRYGSRLFILDDAFQNMKLKKDLDIVLLDSESPFGNGHLLPLGPLREPVSSLSRADMFILTRHKKGKAEYEIESFLKNRFPEKPVFFGDHIPEAVLIPGKQKRLNVDVLNGLRISGFSGIARPDSFRNTLIDAGADVVFFKEFPDHYQYSIKDMEDIADKSKRAGAELLITTEKDWVKIESLGYSGPDISVLSVNFSILSGQDEFFRIIRERLGNP